MLTRILQSFRRWREDRATVAMLDRLDPAARRELEALVRMQRDELEFDSKGRSAAPSATAHIAANARRAHS